MNHTRITRRLEAEAAREAHVEELGLLLDAALLAVADLERDLAELREFDLNEFLVMAGFYLKKETPSQLISKLMKFLEGWRNGI